MRANLGRTGRKVRSVIDECFIYIEKKWIGVSKSGWKVCMGHCDRVRVGDKCQLV